MIVAEDAAAADVEAAIRRHAGPLLRSVALFDIYRGRPLAEDEKILAYRLTFQADDRTLVDPEVDDAVATVTAGLRRDVGGRLADLTRQYRSRRIRAGCDPRRPAATLARLRPDDRANRHARRLVEDLGRSSAVSRPSTCCCPLLHGFFVLGFAQGTIRRLIGIGSILFSFLLAANLAEPLGEFLAANWTQSPKRVQLHGRVSLTVFVAASVAFAIVVQGFYKPQPLFEKARFVDEILGGCWGSSRPPSSSARHRHHPRLVLPVPTASPRTRTRSISCATCGWRWTRRRSSSSSARP